MLIKISAYEIGLQVQRNRIREFKKELLKYNKELQKYELLNENIKIGSTKFIKKSK